MEVQSKENAKGMVDKENESTIDTSPRASVSALRAKFAQGDHVMGMPRPQGGGFADRRAQRQFSSSNSIVTPKSKLQDEDGKPEIPGKPLSLKKQQDAAGFNKIGGSFRSPLNRVSEQGTKLRPALHAKPFLAELNAALKSESKNNTPQTEKTSTSLECSPTLKEDNQIEIEQIQPPLPLAKQINPYNGVSNVPSNESSVSENVELPANVAIETLPLKSESKSEDVIIKKGNLLYRRKPLPPQEKFGPPPLKPPRPPHVELSSLINQTMPPSLPSRTVLSQPELIAPVPPPRPSRTPPAPPVSLPPRPPLKRLPPIPKDEVHVVEGIKQEDPSPSEVSTDGEGDSEDLYEDTAIAEEPPIPNKTQSALTETSVLEQLKQEFQELCDKTVEDLPPEDRRSSTYSCSSSEELYQDTNEEFSESAKSSESAIPAGPQPVYVNKSENKLWRLESRRSREQKEQERRAKEMEKIRKKFGLTGEEIPVDQGLVKDDSRGGRYDLSVKKGETVLIIRMENNPQGKWLAKNERGKIGYVELSNIEVDADSVKTVMTVRRISMHMAGDELYNDILNEEEEAVYEETF